MCGGGRRADCGSDGGGDGGDDRGDGDGGGDDDAGGDGDDHECVYLVLHTKKRENTHAQLHVKPTNTTTLTLHTSSSKVGIGISECSQLSHKVLANSSMVSASL